MRSWLIDKRKAQNFTQEDVAEKSGISRSYYTRIENGEYRVPQKTACKIATALNFDWTLFYTSQKNVG
jgi:transcriptional regulator with XRE-family HTH domain